MIRILPQSILIAAVLAILATSVGCQPQTGGGRDAAGRVRQAKPSPEESFALIVETFRRGIEDVPIGFVLHDDEGHSMMTGRNEVTHKLIPPAKDGEPYKAVITVGSQSRYSIQRSISDEEEEQSEKRTDSITEEGDATDLEVFDRELVSPAGDKSQNRRTASASTEKSDKSVTRQADQQKRDYELVYVDGKWTLITPLDPETEQAIENAFKRALELQI